MGLFDSVIGAVTGELNQRGDLTHVIGGLLADNSELGGLNGLIQKFNQAGLSEHVQSWIGRGENLPISAEQITSVLGDGAIGKIANKLGIDPSQLSGQLSQLLPGMIDKLTPHGVSPEGGLGSSGELMGLLGGLLDK